MADEEKAPRQIHHADCGEVGETGEHGDLGANAVDHPVRKEQAASAIADTENAAPADAPLPPPVPEADVRVDAKSKIISGLRNLGFSAEDAAEADEAAVREGASRIKHEAEAAAEKTKEAAEKTAHVAAEVGEGAAAVAAVAVVAGLGAMQDE